MWTRCRGSELRAFFQNCLILLLVDLLIFPAGLTAQATGALTWGGGDGSYTDSNWTCSSGSCGMSMYPDNPGLDAIINSGIGDLVNLNFAGININSLSLGGGGPMTNSSTSVFTVSGGNDITFGTSESTGNPQGNVLAISNGGTLNIGNGILSTGSGSVTLELSGRGNALNDAGGSIAVTDGGILTLQNVQTSNPGTGASTFVNNGNISVIGTSSSSPASLILNDGVHRLHIHAYQ